MRGFDILEHLLDSKMSETDNFHRQSVSVILFMKKFI